MEHAHVNTIVFGSMSQVNQLSVELFSNYVFPFSSFTMHQANLEETRNQEQHRNEIKLSQNRKHSLFLDAINMHDINDIEICCSKLHVCCRNFCWNLLSNRTVIHVKTILYIIYIMFIANKRRWWFRFLIVLCPYCVVPDFLIPLNSAGAFQG